MVLLATEVGEILRNLTHEQFGNVTKRVFLYYKTHYENEPRLEFEDLLQASYLSILDGSRHWNPEKADLATFLMGAVRSMASHELEKMNQVPRRHLEDESLMFVSLENDLTTNLVWSEILESVGEDSLLRRMVKFRIEDPQMMPRHMVSMMPEVSEEEVYRGWRRLREIIKQWEGTGGRHE